MRNMFIAPTEEDRYHAEGEKKSDIYPELSVSPTNFVM